MIFGVFRGDRAASGAKLFAEILYHPRRPCFGLQKGPSARILVGNAGRHESPSGGIFGAAAWAEREKWRFFAREKVRKKVARPLCCDDGGPLGRPFSLLRAYGGLTGTRLGDRFGVPEGPPFYRKYEK